MTNTDGVLLVTTFPETAIDAESIRSFVLSAADSQIVQEYHYFKVYDNQNVEYILISKGSSDDAYMIGKVAVCEIQNLIIAYKERLDKNNFIQNLLLDNLLLVDVDNQNVEYILISKGSSDDAYMIGKVAVCEIQNLIIAYKERLDKNNFIQNLLLDNLLLVDVYNRAKKLRIDTDVRRVVFMVETKMEKDISAQETVKSLFASRPKDFITAVDEKSIIIVKELKDTDTFEDMNQTARMLVDMLNAEAMSQVRVSYGNPVNEIKSVSRSYKEAKMALEVGKIFYADKNVVPYNNLGIGRLIYQLPIPLCEMFMTEVFGENLPDTFDEETLTTINKFFENNLNVSETSRQLYVHRNTLVYRLEKLEKSTGLDIRKFDDALTFKIAMMVVSYMTYMNNSENL